VRFGLSPGKRAAIIKAIIRYNLELLYVGVSPWIR
jgi:hypothetical protein